MTRSSPRPTSRRPAPSRGRPGRRSGVGSASGSTRKPTALPHRALLSHARSGDTRRGRSQAQRHWHEQNVGRLSFRSDALAASVGCTAAELDAREARVHPDTPPTLVHPTSFTHHPRPPSSRRHLAQVSPLACDVVFDALSRSQSGITDKLGCDERRASYETAQGGFDADAFEEDLARGRASVARSYAIYPVTRLQPPTAAPRLQPPTAHCAPLPGFDQPGVALRLLRVRAAARLPRHDRLPLQLCAALPGELVGLVVTSVVGKTRKGFPCAPACTMFLSLLVLSKKSTRDVNVL